MISLTAVIHDLKTNTLEATWRDENNVQVRCHSYSPTQRDMFIADLGADADRYLVVAGWTPEYCAEVQAKEEREAAEKQAAKEAQEAAERAAAEAAAKAAFDAEVTRQVEIMKAAQAALAAESA